VKKIELPALVIIGSKGNSTDVPRDIMPLKYSILDVFQKVLFSERVAWAVQNAVGSVFPILFVVVHKLRFSGSCTAILFYGVSSQAFSVDRSIGGRVFGAILWTGGYLFGGLLGYLITSVAWLARGDAEGILTYEYSGGTLTETEDTVVQSYLSDGSSADLEDARTVSPGLVQSLVEFNTNTVSQGYYILLIVLHIVCSIYMTRCRTMESDFMSMARGTVSHIFLSVMSTLAVLLPLLGQQRYWADVISGNLKGVTITMFGAIAGPFLVYVQSSHDNLRRDIGDVMINAGKFLTAKTSAMHHCLVNKGTDMSVAQGIAERMSGISSIQELIKETLKAEGDAMCCSLEPAWPMVVSQVGMDFRLYTQLLSSLQRVLGTVNAMTSISVTERFDDLTENDVRIVGVLEQCAVGVSTALQDVAVCLKHMPLWGHCSGNALHWRPKGSAYWNTYLDLLQDTQKESLPYLRESACRGIAASLGATSRQEQGLLTQLQITQLMSSEILIEECIVLEHLAAKALDITDIPYQDMMMAGLEASQVEQKQTESFLRRRVGAIHRRWESLCQNVYMFALSNDLKQGTSYYTYKLQISRFVSTNVALLKGAWLDMNTLKTLFHRRDFQFYLKFFVAINTGFVAIILILWLGYGNTDSSIRNATSMAKWFGDWKPEYFLTASVICLQMQVEISVVKAILRTSLIALGGVLAYVTLLNGTLAQNPYFITFMGILVNGFFGLFSIYGMDFRYSLFLAVYTWNGVVMCHYTGVCCSSGTGMHSLLCMCVCDKVDYM
jgi:hypothetical protein